MSLRKKRMLGAAGVVALSIGLAWAGLPGSIQTTDVTGTIVNENVNYGLSTDVYLSGGPQTMAASGLPDGVYFFQVTDPSGKTLLSTDNAICRQLCREPAAAMVACQGRFPPPW